MSNPKAPLGSLTVICGSMFSGKTEELIRLVRRAMHARKRVQVFKSALDTRCETTEIRTHDGMTFTALTVPNARMLEALLEPDVQVIGIEEAQFFDEAIVGLCQKLADRGVHVIAAGLDQDFRGLPFTFMPQLMSLADNVMKLHAICKVCGEEASRTQRLVDGRPAAWDEPTILVGADESYEARCRRCHRVRSMPRALKTPPPRSGSGAAGTRQSMAAREQANARDGEGVLSLGNGREHKNGAAGKNGKNGRNGSGHAHSVESAYFDDPMQLQMFAEVAADAVSGEAQGNAPTNAAPEIAAPPVSVALTAAGAAGNGARVPDGEAAACS